MKPDLQKRLETLMSRFAAPYSLELQTVVDNQQHCLKEFAAALSALREKMTAKIGPDEEFLPDEEKTDTRLSKAEFTQWLAGLNLVQLHLMRVFLWETFTIALGELIYIHTMLGGLHSLLMQLDSKDSDALAAMTTEIETALKQIEDVAASKKQPEDLTANDSPFVVGCDQSQVIAMLEDRVAACPTLNISQLLYINLLTGPVKKMVAALDRAATGHLRMGTEMVQLAGQLGAKLDNEESKNTFVSLEQREKVEELQKSLDIMGRALIAQFSVDFLFKCSKDDLLLLYSRLKVSEMVVDRIKEMSKGAVVLPKSEEVLKGLKAVGMALADLNVHNLPKPSSEEVNEGARAILRAMHYPVDDGESGDHYGAS